MNIVRPAPSMSSMRKLNEFYRALSAFLSDPANHLASAWLVVRGAAVDSPRNTTKDFRDALVTVDNAVAAVVYFLKAEAREPKKVELDDEAAKDEPAQKELPTP